MEAEKTSIALTEVWVQCDALLTVLINGPRGGWLTVTGQDGKLVNQLVDYDINVESVFPCYCAVNG